MKLKVLGKNFSTTISGQTIPNVRQCPIRPPPKSTPTRFLSASHPCNLQSTSDVSAYQENSCQDQVFGSQGHATSETEYVSFYTNNQINSVKQPRGQQNFLEILPCESNFSQRPTCSVSSSSHPVCSRDPVFSRCSFQSYPDRNAHQQHLRHSSQSQFQTDSSTSVFSPTAVPQECFLYPFVDRDSHHSTSSSELSDDIQDIDTFDFNSSADSVFTSTQMELPSFETFLPRSQEHLEPSLAESIMLHCNSDIMTFPMENEEETSSRSSSCSSMEEEIPHYVTLSSYEEYPFKTESTLEDYLSYPPPELLSPSQDSEGYESTFEGGIPFQHCSSISSGPEALRRQPNSPHSEDDGFFEYIPEETLPDFNLLQNQTNEHVRTPTQGGQKSCSPKEKKHKTRDSPSTMERERRKPGRKPGQVSNVLHLWEFMRDLLRSPNSQGIIEWISRPEGVFRVVNSTEVARLWGEKKKNKKKMTYEKLSRSLRYSRLEGYFSDLPKDKNYPKKLCFKFGPKSNNWH